MRWIDHTESKLDCRTFEWDERKKGEEREGLMILGVEQNVERLSGTGQSQVPSRMTEISLLLLI